MGRGKRWRGTRGRSCCRDLCAEGEPKAPGSRDQSKRGSSTSRHDSFAGAKEKKKRRAVSVGMTDSGGWLRWLPDHQEKRKQKNRARLVIESIDYGDVGVDFDGETVEDGGFVAPLADGIEGRLVEECVAFQHLERTDGAVGGDDGVEFYCAFVADLKGERWVSGLDAPSEHGGIDVGDVNGVWCGSAGDGGLGIVVAEEWDAIGAIWIRIRSVDNEVLIVGGPR